jgi:glycine cleavage system pyridoxal-binding protein P
MNFAENTFKINKDIETLQALVADSLIMGDTVFGKAGVGEIAKQVQERHKELTDKKEHLKAEIDKKEAIVERSNRDFEDVKSRVPDPQPKKVLNVLEDYTMAFLVISYLFMILAGIYVFTSIAQVKVAAFFKALGGSVVLTIFMFMIVYYLT